MMHVVLVANTCALSFGGECALAFRWFEGLRAKKIAVSLVTHVRSKQHLWEKFGDDPEIRYIDDERFAGRIWRLGTRIIPPSRIQLSWATTGSVLRVAFELQARRLIRKSLIRRDTIVHRVSPIAPRWPFFLGDLGVPSVVGPVSALPDLPSGFADDPRFQKLGLYRKLKVAGSMLSRVLSAPDRILCANPHTVSCVPTHLQNRCTIMPENGVVPGQFDPCFQTNDPPVILMVSRLSPEKCCDLGIRAFEIVRSRVDARLIVIGDGPERKRLEQLVADRKLSRDVTFLGHVDHAEVAEHLRHADIYCHPSVMDASPTSVLEAMACGTPTVCADVGAHATWVRPDAGLVAGTGSPRELVSGLAEAMLGLLGSEERRIAMGRAAVNKIKGQFEWPAKIDAALQLYSELLGLESQANRHRAVR